MTKQILWLVVSALMGLSLVMAACGPAAVEEKKPVPVIEEKKAAPVVEEKKQEVVEKEVVKPSAGIPRYGGTLILSQSSDVTRFSAVAHTTGGPTIDLVNQGLWAGDWAKGAAGGYGTNETNWDDNNDHFDLKRGLIAESTKWTVGEAKNEGTIVYKIRQGVHWTLNPASEASRLVGGRELTADDVVFHLKRVITPPAYISSSNPELRVAQITKTGPWEVTVKVPLDALITAVNRFGDSIQLEAPELVAKYGELNNWRYSVGSGPFILIEYVPGSSIILDRNPNYWEKDSIGPGKGNQLPYLDRVQYLIIPDASTRQAALRTGRIDQLQGLSWEDAAFMGKTTPALLTHEEAAEMDPVGMRTDKPPFNDVRVRRALLMATDLKALLQAFYGAQGQILTWPYTYTRTYADLYLGLDDPEMPASVKELYTYNPEKAKALLKEAGYPSGFKTTALIPATEVDRYSVYKDMWSKVGIDLTLDVRESNVVTTIQQKKEHPSLTRQGPCCEDRFYAYPAMTPGHWTNTANIDDPVINEAMEKMRLVVLKDTKEAMAINKELMKHVLAQAYVIPGPQGYSTTFWWPWVKNYSGETRVGYFDASWPTWVWYDGALKKSTGY